MDVFRYNLERSFVNDSGVCLEEADTIGVIHDVSSTWKREQLDIKIIKLLEKHKEKPSFLVLNKVNSYTFKVSYFILRFLF